MVACKNSLVFLHDVRSEIVGRIDHEDISFILRVRHLITTTRPGSCRCCCLIQIYQPYRGLNNNNPNPQARLPAAVQTNLVPRVLSPTRPYGVREAGRRENLRTRLCPNVWTSASSPRRGR